MFDSNVIHSFVFSFAWYSTLKINNPPLSFFCSTVKGNPSICDSVIISAPCNLTSYFFRYCLVHFLTFSIVVLAWILESVWYFSSISLLYWPDWVVFVRYWLLGWEHVCLCGLKNRQVFFLPSLSISVRRFSFTGNVLKLSRCIYTMFKSSID